MSCVAAVVVTRLAPDLKAAAARFAGFVTQLRGLWLAGFPLLHAAAPAFEAVFRKQVGPLACFFGERGLSAELVATGILACEWLTLFARWLPFPLLWDAFQFVEAEGITGVVALSVAILDAHSCALQRAEDFPALFIS